jgi:uncharacterized Rmd1/YagE family protein
MSRHDIHSWKCDRPSAFQSRRPSAREAVIAGELADRLRERARLIERWELFSDQIEVFEDVYEQCAQRAHDFTLANRGHTLELVIIILLLFQTVMVMIEMLSAAQGT